MGLSLTPFHRNDAMRVPWVKGWQVLAKYVHRSHMAQCPVRDDFSILDRFALAVTTGHTIPRLALGFALKRRSVVHRLATRGCRDQLLSDPNGPYLRPVRDLWYQSRHALWNGLRNCLWHALWHQHRDHRRHDDLRGLRRRYNWWAHLPCLQWPYLHRVRRDKG